MTGRAVIMITHWFDPTADFVLEELNRREIPVLRFDTADFPHRLSVTGRLAQDGWSGTLRAGERCVGLEDVSGIYFRRPTTFQFGPMPEPVAEWALAEARSGLGGLLMSHERWLNRPHRVGYAEYKPVQLAEAVRAGLNVPETLITNDLAEARVFVDQTEQVIYKPLSEVTPPGPGEGPMLYTSVVEPQHLAEDGDAITITMHLFQERIICKYAVRLTVVDKRMFAAAIHADSPAARIDWRADQEHLSYESIEVPGAVTYSVTNLMTALGLRFGAFDFLLTPDDEWVFLEVNPNGQWAFIEQATGLPIASAIADALTEQEAPA